MRKFVHQIRPSIRQETKLLIFLVIGAFLVRLILMFAFETYQFPTEKEKVGAEMGWIAANLASGDGFKLNDQFTACMAPVYPFILSLIYRIFDYSSQSSTIAILILQSLISSLIVLPLYFIGKRFFGRETGVIVGLLWILHPASLFLAFRQIWSTSFTALGLAIIILLFLRLHNSPRHFFHALLCGLVIALTALNEPIILGFIPFAALWLFLRSDDRRQAIVQLGLITITSVALIMPWTLRNFMVLHAIVPIKAQLGVNIWLGNYGPDIEQATAGLDLWYKIPETYPKEDVAYLESLNEIELDQALSSKALTFIGNNPAVFAKYTLQRIYLFWRVNVAEQGTLLDRVLIGLIPLTGVGIILSLQFWRDASLLYLLFITYPIIYYLTHAGFPRFRVPIEGMMLVFVAFALSYTLKHIRGYSAQLWPELNISKR